jgi:hypothetical protein
LRTKARWGIATLGMLGLVACGSQSSNYPKGAVLFVDPSSLTYLGAVDSGTIEPQLAAYVSTSQTVTIDLQDHGQDSLTINSVTLADPSGGFALIQNYAAGPDGGKFTTLSSYPQGGEAFVGFYFSPTKAGPYSATITISTNASSDGGLTIIPITALGVAADGGDSDGG